MKKVVFLIFLAMISLGTKISAQETVLEKRTRFFNNYMKEHFPEFQITDGEYFFILPGGCVPCNKAALKHFIQQHSLTPPTNSIGCHLECLALES